MYTLEEMQKEFPDERTCLDWLFKYRYPDGIRCKICGRITKHHYVERRKSYSCQECGHHVHPTSGTIFEKSSTPMTLWFSAIFMIQAGMITSIKELENNLGVTYKTAWRMFKLIRSRLDDEKWQ